MTLKKRARRIDSHALVAQRIKRIPAIKFKLGHQDGMRLSQMQDIGGCRAVMNTVHQVEQLTKVYEQATAKNPGRGALFAKKNDYIANPKASGYRGIHLVYKYSSAGKPFRKYNGLKIEIQLRSRLQHAWATAVETVDAYTSQSLKSNVGETDWKRFFVLMAAAIALIEQRPQVPGTPSSKPELKAELGNFTHHVTMLRRFTVATVATHHQIFGQSLKIHKADLYLLELDIPNRKLHLSRFAKKDLPTAQKSYLEREKQNLGTNILTVLVSADSINALKKAYPNYFLDIRSFLSTVEKVLDQA